MDFTALTDIFRFSHLLVVAMGLGAAFLADFHCLSRLNRPVDDDILTTLRSCHTLVWGALALMWVTGTIMIYLRTGFVIDNVSPKLFSKLITVGVLTLNAIAIGRFAMPVVEAARGQSLLLLPLQTKLVLALVGAVSMVSWLLALAMGVSKVLAASGWLVFIGVLPAAYMASVLLALAMMFLVHIGVSLGRQHTLPVEAPEPVIIKRTAA